MSIASEDVVSVFKLFENLWKDRARRCFGARFMQQIDVRYFEFHKHVILVYIFYDFVDPI